MRELHRASGVQSTIDTLFVHLQLVSGSRGSSGLMAPPPPKLGAKLGAAKAAARARRQRRQSLWARTPDGRLIRDDDSLLEKPHAADPGLGKENTDPDAAAEE